MVEGKIIRDTKSIGSRFRIEIGGALFADASVPAALSVQEFFFRKDGSQVFHLTFDQKEGTKNTAREKVDQKNCIYSIINFRNKVVGYLCERTDNALLGATSWGEIKYGPTMYEAYVMKDNEGFKAFVVETESGRQVALGIRDKNEYEMHGESEIALKVLALFIVTGEVKYKHRYSWLNFAPISNTRSRKILDKYDPNFFEKNL